jgi:hypothetical protein
MNHSYLSIVVYFEHISGFEKDNMWFPTPQKHEGKRRRGKNLKEFGKEEYEKNSIIVPQSFTPI